MAKTIKIMDGYRVAVDNDIEEFRDAPWNDVMDFLNIPNDEHLRDELFRVFFCQRFLNLSDAYCKRDKDGRVIEGHTVIISVIPVDDREYLDELVEEREQTVKERDELIKERDEIQKGA